MEKKELFRKKNLDKVNSPEDLNSYLRVTSPSLLIALGAAVILIIGAVLWGTLQRIETKVKGVAFRNSTQTCCYINATDIGQVEKGKTKVRANNVVYTVTVIDSEPIKADIAMPDQKVRELGGFEASDYVYNLTVDKEVSIGYFSCDIVLKSVSPLEFLFNQ